MQPTSPDPKFDFMLKNNTPAKRGLGLPLMSKPLKIGLGVVLGIIILIVISSVLSGNKGASSQPIIGVMARGQETLRVTAAVQQLQLKDAGTQALAATVTASLTSYQQQLSAYLATNHTKISIALLAANLDKTSDTQMQSASDNNNLDQVYVTYLQQALNKYLSDLQTADKTAGPKGRAILDSAIKSTNTVLSTSPLKS